MVKQQPGSDHSPTPLEVPPATGVDMAKGQTDIKRFLAELRGKGDRLVILVEDAEIDSGWRVVPEADLLEIWRAVESSTPLEDGVPGRLCFNIAEVAEAVGVSQHKVQEWLRRAVNPLPHIKDGRRIIVPADLLTEWLRDEAGRQMSRRN